MAFDSDLKSHPPEEFPADNTPAKSSRREEREISRTTPPAVAVSSEADTNPAVLDPEEVATTLPEAGEHAQIM
ncbi:hypothetical protein ACU18_01485, partial [Arthrobacter sp. ZBG10]|uniref:hypothetical protein n=1 Tax=Arthrobacter sp. ZBG10 TaxID=1676590 RepID=UPI00068276CE